MRYVIAFIIILIIVCIYTYGYAGDSPPTYDLHPKVYCEPRLTYDFNRRPRVMYMTMCYTTYPEATPTNKEKRHARRRDSHHRKR